MRAFVAIPLSDEIRGRIKTFYRKIGSVKGIKSVVPENLHITLDFLGDISDREAALFSENLKKLANQAAPFELKIRGVGAFPRRTDPKILWIGTERSAALSKLAEEVKCAVDSMDDKKFSPHLTVGRVKYKSDDQIPFFDRFFQQDQPDFGTLSVDHFCLMKSDLSGKDPVYSVVHEFKLMGGKSIG